MEEMKSIVLEKPEFGKSKGTISEQFHHFEQSRSQFKKEIKNCRTQYRSIGRKLSTVTLVKKTKPVVTKKQEFESTVSKILASLSCHGSNLKTKQIIVKPNTAAKFRKEKSGILKRKQESVVKKNYELY